MQLALRPDIPRPRSRRLRGAVVGIALGMVLGSLAATGFGASTVDTSPDVTVATSIALTVPGAGSIEPGSTQPGISGVSYNGSTLSLGTIVLGDLSTAGLTYQVTTNNPTGYDLVISNPGTAPVLQSGGDQIGDLPAAPAAVSNPPSTTGFGVAASGDVASQPFVDAQWGGTGSLFRGVPAGPGSTVLASRPAASDIAGDDYRVDYAVGLRSDATVGDGSYAGTVRLTATTI